MPYIGNQPGTGVRSRFIYTATASQTTFTGADNNSKTLKYSDADYIDVYLNGVCLVPVTDYAASTKTSVVLTQAASLNDTLEVVAYDIATISDTVSKADGGTFNDGITITTADNTTQLTLESTDADANSGPVLELYRNSSSPADDDVLGEIEFHGENDADEKIQYGLIAAKLQDASDGTEDVRLSFKTITAGTERERVTIQPTEVVINEDSQDLDFRVESDGDANALFVEGSTSNVGLGTSAPLRQLSISNSSNAEMSFISGTSGIASILFGDGLTGTDVYRGYVQYQHSDDALLLGTAAATQITIDSSGNVGIGTALASISRKLTVSAGGMSAAASFNRSTDSSQRGLIEFLSASTGTTVGEIKITGTTAHYTSASDHRLKENVVDLTGATDRLKQLKPKRFNFIADADTTIDGFLAHEAQAVVPEAVSGEKDEVDDNGDAVMQGIDQSKLVPLLTAALQEAIAKIETLETKVAALEGE